MMNSSLCLRLILRKRMIQIRYLNHKSFLHVCVSGMVNLYHHERNGSCPCYSSQVKDKNVLLLSQRPQWIERSEKQGEKLFKIENSYRNFGMFFQRREKWSNSGYEDNPMWFCVGLSKIEFFYCWIARCS